jgi:hypothetical protein
MSDIHYLEKTSTDNIPVADKCPTPSRTHTIGKNRNPRYSPEYVAYVRARAILAALEIPE